MDHHQQPPQYHHQEQKLQKQYQRRKRSPIKQEAEEKLEFLKIEKRFKNDDNHQDLLVTNFEDVFFSENDHQEQTFTSLLQQQDYEDSLMEVIKVLHDQITPTTTSNITNQCNHQDNQFSSLPTSSSVARFVSEPLISYNQESCGSLYSDESSTVMASTDLVGFDISHLMRYYSDDDQLYQLLQYSKILSLNFAFNEQYFAVDDQKFGNNQVSNKISVSDYLVDHTVDVCVENNSGGCGGGDQLTDEEWIERVLNEVALASESHQVFTEVQ